MHRLNPVDNAFLLAERRHQPLHVGALCLFKLPKDCPPDFVANLARHLRESTTATAPFDRRLDSRWGVKSWVDAHDFDLGQHFVHLSLPRPGRILELLAMISRVHSAHLDRAYPLWRLYLIEGLEDGRIALYSKIHHSLVDGVAGLRLMLKSMSTDIEESMRMPAPWEMRPRRSRGKANQNETSGNAITRLKLGLKKAVPVTRELRHTLQDMRAHHPDAVSSKQAPRCVLNSKITGSRRFAAQSYSTARIKHIAHACGTTTNDTVLALCGAALRTYLLEMNALPEKPLIAVVPMSTRRDESDSGNEITMGLVNLATDLSDPLIRLQRVKASMDHTKSRLSGLTPAQIMTQTVTRFLPGALTFVPGLSAKNTVANVVISHVRGPQEPVYWQGCELDGIFPASLLLDGFALNITLISRHDFIDFGIIACRKSLPGIQRLLDHFEAAIVDLEKCLGPKAQTLSNKRRAA